MAGDGRASESLGREQHIQRLCSEGRLGLSASRLLGQWYFLEAWSRSRKAPEYVSLEAEKGLRWVRVMECEGWALKWEEEDPLYGV